MSENGNNKPKPSQVVLTTGRTVEIDIYTLTHKEALRLIRTRVAQTPEEEQEYYALIEKMSGVPAGEMAEMLHVDFRRIADKCVHLVVNPLAADPN